MRIYNRDLDAAEVAADMEAPIQTPKTEPIASWGFNEDEGSTALDASGNEHSATLHNAEWTTRGKYGGAINFAATNESYLSVPDSPEIDFNEGFTFEAWVRPDDGAGEYGPIIAKQVTGSRAQPYSLYASSESPGEQPYGGTDENTESGRHARGPDRLESGVWSHVALTYDGRKVRLYVNGEEVARNFASPPTGGEGDLEIGGATEVGNYFSGRVDEVRIYNRPLSRDEVESDMQVPVAMNLSESYAVEVEEEGEPQTVIATALLHALGPEDVSGQTRMLLMFKQFGQGHNMTPKQKEEYGVAGKGNVRIQGYRFNDCPDIEKEIHGVPSKASMPGKEVLLKRAKNAESRQCHSFYDAEAEKEFKVIWAISASGLFFRRPNKEVFVKARPVCKQSGPYSPQKYVDCEVTPLRSSDHLDVIGDWKWVEGNYDETIGGGQPDNAGVCGRMDGVLPVNVEPSENGEEVFQGNQPGPGRTGNHFHYWVATQFEEVKSCYFDDPEGHGFLVSGR